MLQLVFCLAIGAGAQESPSHPTGVLNPYNFQYSVDHPDGSQSSRVEKGDHNAVTGSYQIFTAEGLQRVS